MEDFFINPVIRTLLGIGGCFWLAGMLAQYIPIFKRIRIPLSIVAGVIGFILRIWFPELMDVEVLKIIVYHGLALVFITVGLQIQSKSALTKDSLSIGFGISLMGAMQGVIGAATIMVVSFLTIEQIHPGFGLLLPLGFNQGPGQALSFGRAWEASGLEAGADLGIIIAAFGFLWSIIVGIPLVQYGRKKGWVQNEVEQYEHQQSPNSPTDQTPSWIHEPETFVNSLAMVAITYILVYLVLAGATGQLAGKEKLVSMIWGLHFVIALFVSLGMVALIKRRVNKSMIVPHNQRLQILNNFAVDLTTASGLIAIQVTVFSKYIGLVLLLTTLGGLCSLVLALMIFRRAFRELPFHHLVLWFGACTGTFPMGLALLRMIDPNLSSVAPANFTRGAAMALITSAPLLGILGYAIGQYPNGYPKGGWVTLGLLMGYFAILILAWRKLTWKRLEDAEPT